MSIFKTDGHEERATKMAAEEQPMLYGPLTPVGYRRYAKTIVEEELPFPLRPNERADLRGHHVRYRGPAVIIASSGGGSAGKSLLGSLGKSRQQRLEDSKMDGKLCKIYLTNERIVFAKQTDKKGGSTIDIPLNAIQAIAPDKVQTGPTIQLSVLGDDGMDNISMIYISGLGDDKEDLHRVKERDGWMQRIKELREVAMPPSATPARTSVGEDPLKVLQMRLVKGEITAQQYEEIKKMLNS